MHVGIHGGWLMAFPTAMGPDFRQECGRLFDTRYAVSYPQTPAQAGVHGQAFETKTEDCFGPWIPA